LGTVGLKDGDQLRWVLDLNTHDSLLLFTQTGQYFLLPVHQIPEFKWKENGTAIVNVLPIAKDERVVSIIPIKDFKTPQSLLFITKKAQVKRTDLAEYYTTRSTSIAAMKVGAGDELVQVLVSDNAKQLLLVTKNGLAIRFNESEVNAMGRVAAGVRGMALKADDAIVSALLVEGEEGEIGVVSDLGYAKRSLLDDYPVQGRGGKGLPTFEFKEGKRVKPNGSELIGAFFVKESYDLTSISEKALLMSFNTEDAKLEDRKSIGRAVVQLEKDDKLTQLFKLIH
jgi:topoisomerase-4 subunit A